MEKIVDKLTNLYLNDLREFREKFMNLPKVECSTSLEDCSFIFLLVRHLKPKNILEIGTFVGSTLFALIEASEKNGIDYKIHTIDNQNELKLDKKLLNHVVVCHGWSSDILKNIDTKFDFIFADANLDKETAYELEFLIDDDTFFCTHDFVPPYDKGITSVYNMIKYTKLRKNKLITPSHLCNWIYRMNQSFHDNFSKDYVKKNKFENIISSHNKEGINACIAIICNDQFIDSLDLGKTDYSKFLASNKLSNESDIKLKIEDFKIIDKKLYLHCPNYEVIIVSEFIDKLPNIIEFIPLTS